MIYEYECTAGHVFERHLPLCDYKVPQTCNCGAESTKIFTNCAQVGDDLEPFMANTGTYIHSKAQWREHLKKTGCVEISHDDIKSQQRIQESRLKNVEKNPERLERIRYEFDKRRMH